jgi:hypothetical protein
MSARKHGHHGQKDTIAFARNSKLYVPDYAFYPLCEILVVQRNPVYVRVTQRIISYVSKPPLAPCQHAQAFACQPLS